MREAYNKMKKKRGFKMDKKAVMSSTLIYWIIAIVVLALIFGFIAILRGNLAGLGDKIVGFFRG
jgi:hypothetical protein